jgi:hypothetical protein
MRTTARIATTIAVGALALTAIAAPVSAAPANKGTTTIDPSATTLAAYNSLAKPGYFNSAGDIVFGVTGNPSDGTIEHVGGLYVNVLAGPNVGGVLELRNFTIRVADGKVSGIVNDSFRADLFMFDPADAGDGVVSLYFTSTASGAVTGGEGITGVFAGTATVDLN